ncbi:hypothetical protein ABK040_015207 [Willaertia magna]
MEFIKLNDENQLKVKQIIGNSCGVSFLTESGKLFVIGEQNFSNGKNLQQIPQSLFNNELIKEVSDYQNVALVLTNQSNVFLFEKGYRGVPTKYSFDKNIFKIFTFLNSGLILFEDFSIFIHSTEDDDKTLSLLDYLIDKSNQNVDCKEYQLLNYYLENKLNYDFYFCGDNHLNFVVINKETFSNTLILKLKHNLLAQYNNSESKNYFYDMTFI